MNEEQDDDNSGADSPVSDLTPFVYVGLLVYPIRLKSDLLSDSHLSR